jgi:hypothetical protein
MTIVTNTLAAAAVPLSAVAGGKLGSYLAQAAHMPDWASSVLGPAGALGGTVLAIRWLLARLDKAEAKADKRDEERDANLALIASMTVQNQQVIEQNSTAMAEFKAVAEKYINKP